MVNPFICGSGSLREDDDPVCTSPSSTPKKSRKSSKDKSNPFSKRGLDKFNTLLADLEERKQKIYSQMGTHDQDNSMVRFVYPSSANDVVPIVIRLKDRRSKSGELVREKVKDHLAIDNRKVVDKLPTEAGQVPDEKQVRETKTETRQEKADNRWLDSVWNIKLKNWRRPSFYMPVAMVLILLFLVFFGRSVAILCTSIGWYLVPTLSSKKQPIAKKKEYVRGHSEIRMVNNRSSPSPPRSNNNHNKAVKGTKENWHRQTGHRRSF